MNEKEISEQIKNIILKEFRNQEKKGLYSATQKIMAYNSNRIEGSTLTSEQTASLFDTGTLVSNGIEVYKAKDIEEMNGHFKMFNEMLKTLDKPLSSKLIKQYHYQLKSGVFEDLANGYPIGEYKNKVNIVSDIKTSSPKEVPQKIQTIIDKFNNSDKTIEDIAKFHAKYEHIHPFQDGNGRTGRMIIVKQCLENGLIPVIIKDNDKLLYYRALHLAQVEENYTELINFFINSQKEYFNYIKDFLDDYSKDILLNNIDSFDGHNI